MSSAREGVSRRVRETLRPDVRRDAGSNWLSVAAGAPRHAKYDLYCDGANGPSGTIQLTVRDTYFQGGATAARSMRLTNAIGYLVDNCKVFSEANNIVVDGTSYGKFENWPEQNGDFRTVVSQNNNAWNSRTHIEDAEAAWTAWVPVVTGSGAKTIAGLVITQARYKIIGKTITVAVSISFTTATAGGQTVNITLPANVRSLNANFYDGVWIDDDAYKDGYVRPDGVNPTSSLTVGRKDVGNWTLGAGRAVNFVFTFELF